MSATPDYAPVADFALAIAGDAVTGFAAPAGGPLPCLLRLIADGETIALARATRFSAAAHGRRCRLGWCGVELAGLHLAAAIADEFEIHCATSDRLLLRAATPIAATPAAVRAAPLSVFDLIAFVQRDDICGDVAQILPFASASHRHHGIAGLLAASYRSILHRDPEPVVLAAWAATPPPAPVESVLAIILAAPEYRDRPRCFIPGPFHPDFAFDLSPLDA